MPITPLPAFDPARRAAAPPRLWGAFQPVPGTHPDRYTPWHGTAYGRMEAQTGLCARYPDTTSNNCGGWNTRVRRLPLEHNAPEIPLREKNLIDCEPGATFATRCTISPSGARFSADGTLTLTLYVRPFDLQYSAAFATLADYLTNAVTQRGLDPASLTREIHYLRSVALSLPEAQRLPAIVAFTSTAPSGQLPPLDTLAAHHLRTHPLTAHNSSPEAENPRLVRTTEKPRR